MNPHLDLQAKADSRCPVCRMWIAFQVSRSKEDKVLVRPGGADSWTSYEAHSMLVAGVWVERNEPGEFCRAHQSQLAELDRVMHAGRESLVMLPGGES